jgi:hypothetical protein
VFKDKAVGTGSTANACREIRAGCDRPIGETKALDLIEGICIHLETAVDCLSRHGQRWRDAADQALTTSRLTNLTV